MSVQIFKHQLELVGLVGPKKRSDRQTNQPTWRALAIIIMKYCHLVSIYLFMSYCMPKKHFYWSWYRVVKCHCSYPRNCIFLRGNQMYGKLKFCMENANMKNPRISVAGEITWAKTDILENAKKCAIFPCNNFPFLKYFFQKKINPS